MKAISAGSLKPGDLAKVLGISTETIRLRKKEGVFVEVTAGRYNLFHSVQAYIHYIENGRQSGKTASVKSQVDKERARKLKLENDKVEELLLVSDEVREVFANAMVVMRTHIGALPDRLAPAVTGVDDQAENHETINKEVRQALENCCESLEKFGSLEGIIPTDKARNKKKPRSVGRRK